MLQHLEFQTTLRYFERIPIKVAGAIASTEQPVKNALGITRTLKGMTFPLF